MLRMLLVCKWTEQASIQLLSNHRFDRRLLCNTSDKIACFLRFRVCFSFKSHTCILACMHRHVFVCGTIAAYVNCEQMWFRVPTLLLFYFIFCLFDSLFSVSSPQYLFNFRTAIFFINKYYVVTG